EAPRLSEDFVAEQRGDTAIVVKGAKPYARLHSIPLLIRLDQRHGKSVHDPLLFLRVPNAGLTDMLVGGDHIQVAVVVQIDQSHAIVLAVGGAQRLAEQQILIESVLSLAEVEELHFPSKGLLRVVNELDQLFGANPPVRVKNKRECSLLEDGRLQGGLPISDGLRVV